MKKKIVVIVFLILTFNAVTTVCYGYNISEYSAKDFLDDETVEILKENGFEKLDFSELSDISFSDVINYIFKIIKTEITTPFKLIYLIFVLIVIVAIVMGINNGFLSLQLQQNLSIVSVLSAITIVFIPVMTCIEITKDFIKNISDFIVVFVPSFSAIILASGRVSGALGYQSLMVAACEIIALFLSNIIIPILFFYLSISIISRTVPFFKFDNFSATLKSSITWALTLSMSLFVAFITIKGIIGAGTDSLTLRTGKFFVGNFVPVVGGALSEAAATIGKSIGIIKDATGVFGIITVALYFIPPLIKVLLFKFTSDISSSFAAFFGIDAICGLMKDISSVLGILSAIILSFGAVIILSTALTIIFGGV